MFRVEEICPRGKKEEYKKVLMDLWKQAGSIYEQILALKAIGNAALENTIDELQKIVKDKEQPTLVRMEAVSQFFWRRFKRFECSDWCPAPSSHFGPREDPSSSLANLPEPTWRTRYVKESVLKQFRVTSELFESLPECDPTKISLIIFRNSNGLLLDDHVSCLPSFFDYKVRCNQINVAGTPVQRNPFLISWPSPSSMTAPRTSNR